MSERVTGIVRWFDDRKGFGFIRRDGPGFTEPETDVFVHHTAIEGKGHRTLHEMQRVELEIEVKPKGPAAAKVRKLTRDPVAPTVMPLVADDTPYAEASGRLSEAP
jgi:CspA family cold shock protein